MQTTRDKLILELHFSQPTVSNINTFMFLINRFLLPGMVGASVFYGHISGFEPFFLSLKSTLSSIFHEILYNKRSKCEGIDIMSI